MSYTDFRSEPPASESEDVNSELESFNIPHPISPVLSVDDFTSNFIYVIGDVGEKTIEIDGYDIKVSFNIRSNSVPYVKVKSEDVGIYENPEVFWSIVHWLRYIGFPGVRKEFIIVDKSDRYRIGGLYMYAGFELIKREIEYHNYGERNMTIEQQLEFIHDDISSYERLSRNTIESDENTSSSNSHASVIVNGN